MAAIKETLTLYSYHLSSASWRVRAVLALKQIPFKYEPVHLVEGRQHGAGYIADVNPMHQVPALKVTTQDNKTFTLIQSLAIIDYLESIHPENSVFPKDPILRAKAKAIAETIASGVQPLQNLETLKEYGKPLGMDEFDVSKRKQVAQYWLSKKMSDLEQLVKLSAGKYCVGDEVSVADVCLVPQMLNARRFEMDLDKYPCLKQIDSRLQELDMFKKSHPMECPDAPKKS